MIGYRYGLVFIACQRELHTYFAERLNRVINFAKIDRWTNIKKICALKEDFSPWF